MPPSSDGDRSSLRVDPAEGVHERARGGHDDIFATGDLLRSTRAVELVRVHFAPARSHLLSSSRPSYCDGRRVFAFHVLK